MQWWTLFVLWDWSHFIRGGHSYSTSFKQGSSGRHLKFVKWTYQNQKSHSLTDAVYSKKYNLWLRSTTVNSKSFILKYLIDPNVPLRTWNGRVSKYQTNFGTHGTLSSKTSICPLQSPVFILASRSGNIFLGFYKAMIENIYSAKSTTNAIMFTLSTHMGTTNIYTHDKTFLLQWDLALLVLKVSRCKYMTMSLWLMAIPM